MDGRAAGRASVSAGRRSASTYLRTAAQSFRAAAARLTDESMARNLFATTLYEAELGDEELLQELARSIRALAKDDAAGVRWSKEHRYAGYTSYASLNDLPKRDPAFADLAKLLTRHAAKFAAECGFELSRKPRLDS